MTCGASDAPTMNTTPELEIHHLEIVPTFKKGEYFINTHGCSNTGNCRASFPEGQDSKKNIES